MTFVEVLPPERTGPDHPEWFEARRAGISASEIAAVLGIHPYVSPFALYWRKRGVMPEQDDTSAMRWGRRLEAYLADEFTDRHPGHVFVVPAGLYAHSERPWQMASPDRLVYERIDDVGYVIDPIAVVECKTAGSWDGWGDDGTDQVPLHYRAQVLWQMDVLGVPVTYLPVAVGRTYREYVVEYDAEDARVMRLRAQNFLLDVQEGNPPLVDDSDATIATLKRLHPDLDDTEATVPLGMAEGYRRACRNYDKAKAHKRRWEAKVRDRMGRARWAVDRHGDKVATRVIFDRKPYEVGPCTVDVLKPAKEKT